jgi:hypothetical protein
MNGQRIDYIRVSTLDQHTERQLDGIEVDKTFTDTLILDSSCLCDQQFNECTQQRFASLSHVMNELEKSQVEREFLL